MKLHVIMRYVLSSLLVGSVLISGCSSTNKNASQVTLDNVVLEDESEQKKEDPPEVKKIIQQAESYYEKGTEHYEQHRWALAQQEFDNALETLLNAGNDDETYYYKLSQTYDRLFYKIHKLELQRDDTVTILAEEETSEYELSTEELEALLSYTQPDVPLIKKQEEPKIQDFFQNSGDTTGEIVIDESDPQIMKYVKQFARNNSLYRKGMERAFHYTPIIEQTLKEYHLPTELMFLPMIESNYRVHAVSPAGAVGLWQFIRATARRYGLTIDRWVDERRDPEKATKAAALYLADLYQMLGDWDLALAGYYMGEYKVHNAIGKHRTRDIKTLAETRSFGKGARNYISRFKAVVLLTKQAEKYEISLQPSAPLSYDTVEVKKGTYLKDLAQKIGISYKELRDLNPELKQSRTPPGKGTYILKVPSGIGTIVVAQTSVDHQNPDEQKTARKKATPKKKKKKTTRTSSSRDTLTYRVKRGDNLAKIARKYGVKATLLQQVNKIRDAKTIQIGQTIRVPMSASSKKAIVITHKVKKGETLSRIAKQYKITATTLKSYNKIRNANKLRIGQTLKIPLSKSNMLAQNQKNKNQMVTYRVKQGDSLSKIASTFGVSVNQLRRWNNMQRETVIYPGNRIKVWH